MTKSPCKPRNVPESVQLSVPAVMKGLHGFKLLEMTSWLFSSIGDAISDSHEKIKIVTKRLKKRWTVNCELKKTS